MTKAQDAQILIVEDDIETRRLLSHYLKKLGIHRLIETDNGQSALETLKTQDVDLIISDLYMPKMNGMELYQALKKQPKTHDIPFLMVTAESSKAKILEAMVMGIRNYIIKPIDPDNMLAKTKRLLKIR